MSGSMNVTITMAQGVAAGGAGALVGDDVVLDLGVAPKALEVTANGPNHGGNPTEFFWSEKVPTTIIIRDDGAGGVVNGPDLAIASGVSLTEAGVLTLAGTGGPSFNPGADGLVVVKAYY